MGVNPPNYPWSQAGEDFSHPTWSRPRRGPSGPLLATLVFGGVLLVTLAVGLGLMLLRLRAAPMDRPATVVLAERPDPQKAVLDRLDLLAAKLDKVEKKERRPETEPEKPPVPAVAKGESPTPPKPTATDSVTVTVAGAAAPPVAAASSSSLQTRLDELFQRLDGTTQDARAALDAVESGLKEQANRLKRIEDVLESYRRQNVAEPGDTVVIAFNSKDLPFLRYRTAYEDLVYNRFPMFKVAGLRLGLSVANSGVLTPLVALDVTPADLEKARDAFRKIGTSNQSTDDVAAALTQARKQLEPPRGADPKTARRCLLVVSSSTAPPQPDFKPEGDWRGLKVDVVMLAPDANAVSDLGPWVDFCASRGGVFRLIHARDPLGVGGANPPVPAPAEPPDAKATAALREAERAVAESEDAVKRARNPAELAAAQKVDTDRRKTLADKKKAAESARAGEPAPAPNAAPANDPKLLDQLKAELYRLTQPNWLIGKG